MLNTFALIILVALLVEYGLGLLADALNLRALSDRPPAEFDDVYDAERYRRSQEYTRVRTRFAWIPTTLDLVLVLSFWWLDGFARWDTFTRGLGWSSTATGLVFLGGIGFALFVVHLPFRYYATFTIEERFGFNKTDRKTFWTDQLKSLLLAGVLGGPILAAVLALLDGAGPNAWLYCWGVSAAFILVLQYIAPTWLMPLFNEFKPLEEGELKTALVALGKLCHFPLHGIFVIDGSKRSSKANAFFTGFGDRKRIALYDTLVEQHEPDELIGVVAHEIGHYKRRHIIQTLALSLAHLGAIFYLLSVTLGEPQLFAAFGLQETSVHAGLIFFGLLYTPVEMLLSLALQAFSRKNEFEADAYAAEVTGQPEALVRALKKLAADSLSNLTPHPLFVALHHSHPPLPRRVAALRARAETT